MKVVRNYLFVTIFCAAFGGIYEAFSFGVYSRFMIYAFGWPLVFGVIPALFFYVKENADKAGAVTEANLVWPKRFWHTGVAILTVGSIFRGILDIYGTSSRLVNIYWIVGGVMLGSGLLLSAFTKAKRPRNEG